MPAWSNLDWSRVETRLPEVSCEERSDRGKAKNHELLVNSVRTLLCRASRRNFFDLYVLLHTRRVGFSECMAALTAVYQQPVNQGLLLRALCYFDDADAEAPLPGEGPGDWKAVKAFFSKAVGALVVPPSGELAIQRRIVDVTPGKRRRKSR